MHSHWGRLRLARNRTMPMAADRCRRSRALRSAQTSCGHLLDYRKMGTSPEVSRSVTQLIVLAETDTDRRVTGQPAICQIAAAFSAVLNPSSTGLSTIAVDKSNATTTVASRGSVA